MVKRTVMCSAYASGPPFRGASFFVWTQLFTYSKTFCRRPLAVRLGCLSQTKALISANSTSRYELWTGLFKTITGWMHILQLTYMVRAPSMSHNTYNSVSILCDRHTKGCLHGACGTPHRHGDGQRSSPIQTSASQFVVARGIRIDGPWKVPPLKCLWWVCVLHEQYTVSSPVWPVTESNRGH